MNPEVKKKWVEALRSGEFNQTEGALRRGPTQTTQESFCCLGVLTEVYRKETGNGKWGECPGDVFLSSSGNRWGGFLPEPVIEWADLENHDPRVGQFRLSVYNDKGVPFSEIAGLIEEHL